MTTYTNKEILLDVKSMAFTDELITKTRERGLPWLSIEPNLYTVTICQPPRCQSPSRPSAAWTYYVTRNKTSDGTYTYYLEVLLNDLPFMTISSRQVKQVEMLFRSIELARINPCDLRIDQAIGFISEVPTSPTSDVTNFSICGGVTVEGSAIVTVRTSPSHSVGGVKIAGVGVVTLSRKAKASLQSDTLLTGTVS